MFGAGPDVIVAGQTYGQHHAQKNDETCPVAAGVLLGSDWLWGALLVLGVLLAYLPVWHAGFVWDDDQVVTANPVIVGPSAGLKEIWLTGAGQFYPLTLTTFWLEYLVWGNAPMPYHVVNVLMHAASACLLWQVLRNLNVTGAWLGAALWALHPVQAESVAWITEMKNTESGLFFLLAILFFVRWRKGTNAKHWNYGLALLFAAMAMASKSSAVVLPAVLCLCAWWLEGRWKWRFLLVTGPVFIMALVDGILSVLLMKAVTVADPLSERDWPQRLADAGDAIWFYLGKLIWPHPLIPVYPTGNAVHGEWTAYLPLLAALLILSILWLKRDSWARPYFFAFAYFFVVLLPALGLISQSFMRHSVVADHLQYLADMGPLALIGAGMFQLASLVKRPLHRIPAVGYAGLLLILGALSWQRAAVYQDQKALWGDALIHYPGCSAAYNNLGLDSYGSGQVYVAIGQFEKALELDPKNAEALDNLGIGFCRVGRLDDGVAAFQGALKISPHSAVLYYNLGNALRLKRAGREALEAYQKAVELDPANARAHFKVGRMLLEAGRLEESQAELEKAVAIDPKDAEAHDNLGMLFAHQGMWDAAIGQYQAALDLRPHDAAIRKDLDRVLDQKKQADEAQSAANPNAASRGH